MKTLPQKSSSTPAALGYQMPAEWEPHEATWLSWPQNRETWPSQLADVEAIYVEMIAGLVKGEKVHLLVQNEREEEKVRNLLEKRKVNISRVIFFRIPTVDTWIRDYGPTFIVKKERRGPEALAYNHWIFNAWGGKYEALKADTRIPGQIAPFLDLPFFEPGIVLEGGSIEVNGKGTVLTTEQCLLNPNRNPHLNRAQIEQYLKDHLGVTKVLWLKEGIAGDDTDGHIDDITRFVSPDTVLTVVEEDPNDVNYEPLRENLEKLKSMTDQDGKALNVLTMPMPGIVGCPSGRLPASYANFYIGNAVVLAPVYEHANDRLALDLLRRLFPGREVIGISCEALVYGLGAIHCVSQQQPKKY